ncbi:histidine kinase [Streptomyces sp. HSW2009]|uniref:sensor histidine kinase n=1 Tax=Streptomyces sp. HSW2009 TaxID=3142890 RepID=UPI0032EAA969
MARARVRVRRVLGVRNGWPRRLIDLVLPLLLGCFLTTLMAASFDGAWPLAPLWLLAGFAQGGALWWRRSYPVQVMAVALLGGVVVHLVAPEGVFPYAGLIAVGSLAAARPPLISLCGLAGLLGVTALNFRTGPSADAQFAMAVAVVPWALGEAVRHRRAAIAEATRRAIGEEQARIARELHDVIAHSVSVIVVQAAAADDVFDDRPDQARAALQSIESAGRIALGELRRLLAAVRPGEAEEPRRPQPGLDRLAELAEPLRAAGLRVTLRREDAAGDAGDAGAVGGAGGAAAAPGAPGRGRPLPAGVELSAYRIVQEALTNTLRHSGASEVVVTVRTTAGTLELEVRDDGRTTQPTRPAPPTGAPSLGASPTSASSAGAAPVDTAPAGASPLDTSPLNAPPAGAAPTRPGPDAPRPTETAPTGSKSAPAPQRQPQPLPRTSPGSGFGLVGMRERATMLGGTLEAGPLPEGGFRVWARLPLDTGR